MNLLLLFPNTRTVVAAEQICRRENVTCQVIPVPKHISAECGMAILVAATDAARVRDLLAREGHRCEAHPFAAGGRPAFDLLSTVEQGGCSAKLPADQLLATLRELPPVRHPDLLVGSDTCADAGVWRLSPEVALIQTTDFFPPICSDPYEFGQIAAANALSDVYAMGGRVLTAMNLVMFPASGIPLAVLTDILRGGQDKVAEAGGIMVGGHTIADAPPKYGLAVTGVVHPDRLVTNAAARPGERLVLAKALGTGVLVAGQRVGEAAADHHHQALASMKQLNRAAAEIMQRFALRCATDITGFGLLGHALHIARASNVTLALTAANLPALPGARALLDLGCIPGGAFRNQAYVEAECTFAPGLALGDKLLALDPQTSGGLLMTVPPARVEEVVAELRLAGYGLAAAIGEVRPRGERPLALG